jgi:release factor glutamine methyltransferase
MRATRLKLLNLYKEHGYDEEEACSEVDFAIELISGLSGKERAMGFKISSADELLETIERRLKTREPLAYIIGKTFFMNEKFIVSKDTLIPRPETEILVKKSVELTKKHSEVLDLGTGSGCIACMIAKLADVRVLGTDISKNALQIALDNAENLGLTNRAVFRKSDFFSNIQEKFDIIVSNPPYIPLKEKENLQFEVLKYEPELALFAADEFGVENYEKIISQAHNFLNPGGHVVFELGINQCGRVYDMLETENYKNIEIIKDLNGIERVISARFIV